jgi:hypothetical protein
MRNHFTSCLQCEGQLVRVGIGRRHIAEDLISDRHDVPVSPGDRLDALDSMEDGRVIAAAKALAYIRQALVQKLTAEVHRDLTRPDKLGSALVVVQLRQCQPKMVDGGALDHFDRDGTQIVGRSFQGVIPFAPQNNRDWCRVRVDSGHSHDNFGFRRS